MSRSSGSSRNSSPRAMPVETIITRFKSAQQKRQLREMDRSMTKVTELLKNPLKPKKKKVKKGERSPSVTSLKEGEDKRSNKKKKSEKSDIDEEYCPLKVKRHVVLNKVRLKPRHELKVIARANKRKRSIPIKGPRIKEPEPAVDSDSVSRDSSPRAKRSKPLPQDMTMDEMIQLIEESGSLNDEDLLEILTCPSPVWWEDPPDGYIEDALFTRPRSTAEMYPSIKTQLQEDLQERQRSSTPNVLSRRERIIDKSVSSKPEVKDKAESSNNDIDLDITLSKRDEKFIKKRSKLESVLGNLKNKTIKNNESDDKIKPAIVISEDTRSNEAEMVSESDVSNKVSVIKNLCADEVVKDDGKEKTGVGNSNVDTDTEKETVSIALDSETDDEHLTDISFHDEVYLDDLENMDIPMQKKSETSPKKKVDENKSEKIPITDSNKVAIPIPDSNEDAIPIPDSNNDTISIFDANKDATPIPDSNKDTISIFNANKDSTPIPDSNNDSISVPDTNRDVFSIPHSSKDFFEMTEVSNKVSVPDLRKPANNQYVMNSYVKNNPVNKCQGVNFREGSIDPTYSDRIYNKSIIEDYFEMNLVEEDDVIIDKKKADTMPQKKNPVNKPKVKYCKQNDSKLTASVIKFKNPDNTSINVFKIETLVPNNPPPLINSDRINNITGCMPDNLPPLIRNPVLLLKPPPNQSPQSIKSTTSFETDSSGLTHDNLDSISDTNICFLNEDEDDYSVERKFNNELGETVIRSCNDVRSLHNLSDYKINEFPNQDPKCNKFFLTNKLHLTKEVDLYTNFNHINTGYNNDLEFQSLTITKVKNNKCCNAEEKRQDAVVMNRNNKCCQMEGKRQDPVIVKRNNKVNYNKKRYKQTDELMKADSRPYGQNHLKPQIHNDIGRILAKVNGLTVKHCGQDKLHPQTYNETGKRFNKVNATSVKPYGENQLNSQTHSDIGKLLTRVDGLTVKPYRQSQLNPQTNNDIGKLLTRVDGLTVKPCRQDQLNPQPHNGIGTLLTRVDGLTVKPCHQDQINPQPHNDIGKLLTRVDGLTVKPYRQNQLNPNPKTHNEIGELLTKVNGQPDNSCDQFQLNPHIHNDNGEISPEVNDEPQNPCYQFQLAPQTHNDIGELLPEVNGESENPEQFQLNPQSHNVIGELSPEVNDEPQNPCYQFQLATQTHNDIGELLPEVNGGSENPEQFQLNPQSHNVIGELSPEVNDEPQNPCYQFQLATQTHNDIGVLLPEVNGGSENPEQFQLNPQSHNVIGELSPEVNDEPQNPCYQFQLNPQSDNDIGDLLTEGESENPFDKFQLNPQTHNDIGEVLVEVNGVPENICNQFQLNTQTQNDIGEVLSEVNYLPENSCDQFHLYSQTHNDIGEIQTEVNVVPENICDQFQLNRQTHNDLGEVLSEVNGVPENVCDQFQLNAHTHNDIVEVLTEENVVPENICDQFQLYPQTHNVIGEVLTEENGVPENICDQFQLNAQETHNDLGEVLTEENGVPENHCDQFKLYPQAHNDIGEVLTKVNGFPVKPSSESNLNTQIDNEIKKIRNEASECVTVYKIVSDDSGNEEPKNDIKEKPKDKTKDLQAMMDFKETNVRPKLNDSIEKCDGDREKMNFYFKKCKNLYWKHKTLDKIDDKKLEADKEKVIANKTQITVARDSNQNKINNVLSPIKAGDAKKEILVPEKNKKVTNKKVNHNNNVTSPDPKDQKCIIVSNTKQMRYCMKCSSIFDTKQCNYCYRKSSIDKKQFATDYLLKMEQCFVCDVCRYKALSKDSLERHIVTHCDSKHR